MQMASGGNLPSFIGKITGGEITFDSDLTTGNYSINHGLGAVPKGIVIYRLTGNITASSTEKGAICALWIYNATGATGAWIDNSFAYTEMVGAKASVGIQSQITTGIRNITDSKFDITGTSSRPFKANETYYWLAWT